MIDKKGHRAALAHLMKQMRDMEFSQPHASDEDAGEEGLEDAGEGTPSPSMSPLQKMAKGAEAAGMGQPEPDEDDDPETARRKNFMKGIRPMQKRVSVTVVAPMGKGKMKRG